MRFLKSLPNTALDYLEEFPIFEDPDRDMDAFAEETGYEGTFTGKQFLFQEITNPNMEVYDHFNPYDEDECIIQGSMANRDFYKDNYGSYESQEPELGDDKEGSQPRGRDDNSFKPFGDVDDLGASRENNDGARETFKIQDGFMGYEDLVVETKESENPHPDMQQTAEDSENFLGYHQEEAKQENNKSSGNTEEAAEEVAEESSKNEDKDKVLEKPSGPLFAPLDKSALPMTSKIDSILSKELKNVTLEENYFLLPTPEPGDRSSIKINIYLFNTKKCVQVHASTKSKVIDIIRHVISITKSEVKDPAAYELRLIDDDEDYYVPFYEISALVPSETVGEFTSLAFVNNKNYKPPKVAADLSELSKSIDNQEVETACQLNKIC